MKCRNKYNVHTDTNVLHEQSIIPRCVYAMALVHFI